MIRKAAREDLFYLTSFLCACDDKLTVADAAIAIEAGEIMVDTYENPLSSSHLLFKRKYAGILWKRNISNAIQIFLFIDAKMHKVSIERYKELLKYLPDDSGVDKPCWLIVTGTSDETVVRHLKALGYNLSVSHLKAALPTYNCKIKDSSLSEVKYTSLLSGLVIQAIHEVFKQLPDELQTAEFKQMITESLADSPSICIIAIKDNKPVGIALGKKVVLGNTTMGLIQCVFVLPSYRGNRIGSKLFVSLIDRLKALGAQRIEAYWFNFEKTNNNAFLKMLKNYLPAWKRGSSLFIKTSYVNAVNRQEATSLFI